MDYGRHLMLLGQLLAVEPYRLDAEQGVDCSLLHLGMHAFLAAGKVLIHHMAALGPQ